MAERRKRKGKKGREGLMFRRKGKRREGCRQEGGGEWIKGAGARVRR